MRRALLFILLLAFTITSCTDDNEIDNSGKYKETAYTIAIVLPLDQAEYEICWKRTVGWAMENIAKAQNNLTKHIKLNIEWYDENNCDLAELGTALSKRDDILTVIGPYSSKNALELVPPLAKEGKMIIAPDLTSAELIRSYAGKGFFWALCETDITQCEVLLNKAHGYGIKTISLIADETVYGQTFIDWFAFQTTEMGMTSNNIYNWNQLDEALNDSSECIICIPNGVTDVKNAIDGNSNLSENKQHTLLFSDTAFDPTLPSYFSDKTAEKVLYYIEGVAPYADPASGFEIAYNIKFNATPTMTECCLYDAVTIAALVAKQFDNTGKRISKSYNKTINGIMKQIMSPETSNGTKKPCITVWNSSELADAMADPLKYNISGATGTIDFDTDMQGAVAQTVYGNWMVYNGKYVMLDFLTTDGTRRTSSTTATWNWKASVMQNFENINTPINYESLQSQWAVLVCSSRGWSNYRHTSDVLNMYRLLRKNGYDDSHIILISNAEEIATNEKNIYKGKIYNITNGDNLYKNVQLDYSTDTISSEDVCNILFGKKSRHLPVVLPTDGHSNILLYWSGHGSMNNFIWGNTYHHFSAKMLNATVQKMADNNQFRKLLICSEPCYSASVLRSIDGIPGVLGIASSNTHESSFADHYDTNLAVWLCDLFSNNLIYSIENHPGQTFIELYHDLVKETTGSHVTVLNYARFDNLYLSHPNEFFVRMK